MKKTYVILLSIFLLSVIIRIPNLNRPLSKHHEFCTASALRVIEIWSSPEGKKHLFKPIMTYPGAANKHINNYSSPLEDKGGNNYYISFPPLGYILPYFTFKLLFLQPTILGLQLFNIFFHFICGIFIYLIIRLICKHTFFDSIKNENRLFTPAIAGFVLYIFNPCSLWFQGNVYSVDIFVQSFWIPGVYVLLKIVLEQKQNSFKWLLALFAITFLMAFTEWLGFFFIASIILFAIIKLKKDKSYLKLAFVSSVAGILSLLATVYLYADIAGFDAYYNALMDRFIVRTGHGNMDVLYTVQYFLFNYATSYLPLLTLLILFFFLLFPFRKEFLKNRPFRYFSFFSIVPVILHHFIFLNYTGHDFAVLKSALFLSVAGGFAIHFITKFLALTKLMNIAVAGTVLLSIGLYYMINVPGELSWKKDRYDTYQVLGKTINKSANAEEVVFIKGFDPEPQLIIYAKRNVLPVQNEHEAIQFLRQYKRQKGILFDVKDNKITETVRLTNEVTPVHHPAIQE